MALWDRIGSRGNVEDRRGMGIGGLGGGISITGVALVLLVTYLTGGDITDVLTQLPAMGIEQQQTDTGEFAGEDEYEVFASTVLGSTNDMWEVAFSQNNLTYTEPRLVLFRELTQTGCGVASSQVGPFYCPVDETIYLDETFFEELTRRFGAEGGDVAEAYVIAHEVGHHAQNEFSTMDEVQQVGGNDLSIKLELQADCFAGLWAYSIKDEGVFEGPNEIQEAIDAASAVGDDRIQERVSGEVNPETWTHGSSEERVSWFTRGYESGNLLACDPFKET